MCTIDTLFSTALSHLLGEGPFLLSVGMGVDVGLGSHSGVSEGTGLDVCLESVSECMNRTRCLSGECF